jgi:hypothetical protein
MIPATGALFLKNRVCLTDTFRKDDFPSSGEVAGEEGAAMAFGSFTMACLLLAAGAGSPEPWHVNTTRFQIPIKILPERRAEIRELVLYVSTNQGQSWEMAARATPDKEAFPFIAPGDGTYWFSVAIIDHKGQQEPHDPMQAAVGQRIVIDTVKPEVRSLLALWQGNEIEVRWDVREEHPDLGSLKLEYRTADMGAGVWGLVPLNASLNGQTRFHPEGTGTVSLRLQMQDLAGNVGMGQAEVPGAGGAVTPAYVSPVSPPPSANPPPPGNNVSNWSPQTTGTLTARTPGRPTELPDAVSPNPSPSPGAPLPPVNPPTGTNGGQVLATSAPSAAGSPAAPVNPVGSARGVLPPVQIVNKRKLSLDFEVAKFGPSGLGSVDVYLTLDDGQTWERTPADAGAAHSLQETRGGGPVRGSVTVQLNKEGTVYGFCVLVKSRAGLSKPPPQKGDVPQIRVEVDTTPPEAELYGPQPEPGKRDTLILTWKASDRNLATNPITIEWAERKEGQWSFIGPEALPNSGRYSWQVPANVPPSVFLRLTVRDAAGNTAVAQTPEPVLIDFSVPEVNVIGLSGNPRP